MIDCDHRLAFEHGIFLKCSPARSRSLFGWTETYCLYRAVNLRILADPRAALRFALRYAHSQIFTQGIHYCQAWLQPLVGSSGFDCDSPLHWICLRVECF